MSNWGMQKDKQAGFRLLVRNQMMVARIFGLSDSEAAFLLRAVNSHADLLTALEAFEHFPCEGTESCTNYPAGLCPGCHARAAIKKAKLPA